ncbi:MAG: aminotransferase class I/II-fold pyridoxal phosphate-dependent enzyme [Lachnospiraceae bacterium]|jgi:DNA-binding transcriptional MocR family regulator|nr:aminotransferase class I/II-fold pyridoxal phosphate-dependent enzyme [Lachnospiraceae bacterium]MCI9357526.1 aminotransferase class I/II-fold pyridoxal phosphate-dependent enzyme [Lachnospiraceae bacterium]
MKAYGQMNTEELLALKEELTAEFEDIKSRGASMDMSRGKPGEDQLALSMGMLDVLDSSSDMKSQGTDTRNYGQMDGLLEMKKLLADMVETDPENVIVYGNASLNIMFDTVSRSMTHGVMGSTPWCRLDRVKFLCPVPGYDRHFSITEYFGIEMIPVEMTENGPDMDTVEKLVEGDEAVKGMWCVPKYSNPQGYTYSEETVRRLAAMKPKAADFRIYWDNAYAVHHLYGEKERQDWLPDILALCKEAGNPDMVYEFVSTSKVTFPGAGVCMAASSEANRKEFLRHLQIQTIGHDKVNQLRHVRFLRDMDGVREHMKKQGELTLTRFEAVWKLLESELGGLGIGTWTYPRGGYFISFEAMDGCARAIVAKAKEAGLTLTPAGSSFPYKKDPKDSNIRIAPTYPSVEELQLAGRVFVLSVKLVTIDKLLENK